MFSCIITSQGALTMYKKALLATIAVIVLSVLTVAGKSHFRQKNALKIVQTVLTFWKNNDPIPAMSYWEEEIDSPPIYDLSSYEIGKKEFDKKDGLYRARMFVTLYFPEGNRFPSGREWLFELNKTRYGWKIVNFQLQE
jgi:hypothetical protein